MTAHGPVTSSPIQRLMSHKEYLVKKFHSIIKDTNMDVYGKHATKDLGVSGLFDLVRVSIHKVFLPFSFLIFSFFIIIVVFCRLW